MSDYYNSQRRATSASSGRRVRSGFGGMPHLLLDESPFDHRDYAMAAVPSPLIPATTSRNVEVEDISPLPYVVAWPNNYHPQHQNSSSAASVVSGITMEEDLFSGVVPTQTQSGEDATIFAALRQEEDDDNVVDETLWEETAATLLSQLMEDGQGGGDSDKVEVSDSMDVSIGSLPCAKTNNTSVRMASHYNSAIQCSQITKSCEIQSQRQMTTTATTTRMANKKSTHKRQVTASTVGSLCYSQSSAAPSSFASALTGPSDDDEEEEDDDDDGWWNNHEESPMIDAHPKQQDHRPTISITMDTFDLDHLNFLHEDGHSPEDEECESKGELQIVKQLRKNARSLYWLQLTTPIQDVNRLAMAMVGNTSVRNVTIYPSAMQPLKCSQQMQLIESICQLPSLTNLIVFQDGGNLFLDPLNRYRPPLTRLTLYKLDLDKSNIVRLTSLLKGLATLEELSLEKYHGSEGDKLLSVMAKVVPSLPSLAKLTLTPARSVQRSSKGSWDLFRALKQNTSITTLSLQGGEDCMDQACIDQLAETLTVNATLHTVKLSGFWRSRDAFWKRFDTKSQERINYFLKLNQSGVRKLQLDTSVSLERLRDVLISNKDHLDHVFYLLHNHPSMVTRSQVIGKS